MSTSRLVMADGALTYAEFTKKYLAEKWRQFEMAKTPSKIKRSAKTPASSARGITPTSRAPAPKGIAKQDVSTSGRVRSNRGAKVTKGVYTRG